MPRQRCFDVPGGDTVLYDIVDESTGFRQCIFGLPEEGRSEKFLNVQNIKCRHDDIFFHAYPKTGSNWMWEMLALMLNKTSRVGDINKTVSMIEVARPLSLLDEMPSPRLLNSHIKVRYTPKDAVVKKIKTVLLFRNPKDVAVSFYNHTKGLTLYDYEGKFENFLQMFIRGDVDCGSYAQYIMEWQQHIRNHPDLPVHIVYYEDLIKNCYGELKIIQEFLQLDVTDALLREITDNCSLGKMRESKAKQSADKGSFSLKKISKPGFNMLRKGKIGDWKNWFTVAQNEMFDAWWERETKGLDILKFRYSY